MAMSPVLCDDGNIAFASVGINARRSKRDLALLQDQRMRRLPLSLS
jgi:hypothetical protein